MEFCPCAGCQNQKYLCEIDENYQPIDVHKYDYIHAEECAMNAITEETWSYRKYCTCTACIDLRSKASSFEKNT